MQIVYLQCLRIFLQSPPEKVTQAVNCAIEAGYRHIDGAYVYGNEVNIAPALKEQMSKGQVKREDLFITSKLWWTFHSAEDVKPALQESLKRLGVEYLDLYLIHWPTPCQRGGELLPEGDDGNYLFADTPIVETWKAIEKCVDEGLVKNIGLSNFNSVQVQEIIDNSRIKPSVLQVEIHPYFSQEKLVKFCHDRNMVVTAYSPLGSSDIDGASPEFTNLLGEPILKTLGTKYGKTPAQVVLRWHVQRNIVVIPKSVTPSWIKENIQIFDFQLTADDMETVNGLNQNHRLIRLSFRRDDG
ncbi:hypothetical protein NP493_22g07022 [Ridgeia piscesae]|uniref:NADP-dependent oxidoreductase domain-containing protein n=1 Tax=Ridgeia piscesae TaxID=27915 RepID=A0AAD9UKF8_RIDPI|nr:hypothetical protein NP493_22g07022 [Ridgeia piscesae]